MEGEVFSNAASRATFWPAGRLVRLGNKRTLQRSDIFPLPPSVECQETFEKFEPYWLDQLKLPKPSLFRALFRFLWVRWLGSFVLALLSQGLQLVLPLILPHFVEFLMDRSIPVGTGVAYLLGVSAAAFLISFTNNQQVLIVNEIGLRARHCLHGLVYRKALRKAATSLGDQGRCVNLISTDAQVFVETLPFINYGLVAPFLLAVIAGLLYQAIGWLGLFCAGLALLTFPMSVALSRRAAVCQRSQKNLYIFDDPLSALDMHVGNWVLNECITGFLKTKTRVLVTNHLHYLERADKIAVMDKGTIKFFETTSRIKGSLMLKEKKEEGNVDMKVYMKYFASGGWVIFGFLLFGYANRTPLGRLISRFSRDTGLVDARLPNQMEQYMGQTANLFVILTTICMGTWWMALVLAPVVVLYYWIQRYYRHSGIEVQRLEGLSRTPVFVHFDNTLSGLACIRACRCAQRFEHKFWSVVNENARAAYTLVVCKMWFSQRLDWVGALIQLLALSCLVVNRQVGTLNAGLVGLSLANMASITIFLSTVRYNLDPFGMASEDQIYAALEQVQLKEHVLSLPEKLDSRVLENGENFSTGQRQLICMARAILRNARILILDEATASVDMHTDILIQKMLRSFFAGCTVFTIAHRLHTIMDSSRVMVISEGALAEFDAPTALLAREGGLFAAMVHATGDEETLGRLAAGDVGIEECLASRNRLAMSEETVACPLCGDPFPVSVIAEHADSCAGKAPAGEEGVEESDYEMALRLQRELDGEAPARDTSRKTVRCEACGETTSVDSVYILDECTHKFCRPCIERHVAERIAVSATVACPVPGCGRALSVGDMKHLVPKRAPAGGGSSRRASQRLVEELGAITRSDPAKNGYSVEPVDDNIYQWEVKFFGFDKSEPIAQDMHSLHVKSIVMLFKFPSDYPFSPPFCRVIRPRFQFRTGHVTVGGSICMELLTRKGWSPENTVEAVVMSIRSSFLSGGARLDRAGMGDYTEQEARIAFDRLVQQHGWE
eukprot:m51a1_g11028 putative multidrug resistance-associated protein 5-like (1011) ;mRNA; f:416046-422054